MAQACIAAAAYTMRAVSANTPGHRKACPAGVACPARACLQCGRGCSLAVPQTRHARLASKGLSCRCKRSAPKGVACRCWPAVGTERLVLPVLTALHVDVFPLRRAARPPNGVLMPLCCCRRQQRDGKRRQEKRRHTASSSSSFLSSSCRRPRVELLPPLPQSNAHAHRKANIHCADKQVTGDRLQVPGNRVQIRH